MVSKGKWAHETMLVTREWEWCSVLSKWSLKGSREAHNIVIWLLKHWSSIHKTFLFSLWLVAINLKAALHRKLCIYWTVCVIVSICRTLQAYIVNKEDNSCLYSELWRLIIKMGTLYYTCNSIQLELYILRILCWILELV